MVAVQAALDELLAAQASVQGITITNQATLDYVETLVETDGTPASYIVNGDVTITAATATGYEAGYIEAISKITATLASVIGTVTITTATTDAALDIAKLTYVSGDLSITGKMPSGFAVSTAASLALDVNEADITLASLTSAAGGVRITTGTTTVTNVSIANLTNGAVTTGTNALVLALADVDLGAGHPATTTTVKSLIAGNATNALTGATLTITGALTLGSKVVTDTTIDAGGAVTLSSGVAGSSVGSSTITSGGDINIAALTLGAAGATALAITTDGGAGGSITLGATTSGATFTATASGSTVNAASWHTNGAGTATLAGSAVTLTGLATNTGALAVNTATALSLPALAKSAGTITAAAATSFSAPLLTTEANVDIAAAATFAAKALGAVGNWVDIATGTSLTLTAQDADLDLSAAVHMVTLDYTGAAVSAAASEDTDLTYAVYTSASSLTTVSLNGGMGDVIIKAPLVTGLSTAAGSTVRTLTTSGTALTSIAIGHQGYNGGAQSAISVVDTKITSLDMNAMKWLGILTVSGNTSLTAITMPTATAAADNVNVAVAGANVSVTIIRNALVGAWTAATAATSSSLYTEGSFSTAAGITNAKTWLNALLANVVIANASVTYEIEIDAADAAMETNKGVSVAINGTSRIDTVAELALLPN
jgi:hypothetical protein